MLLINKYVLSIVVATCMTTSALATISAPNSGLNVVNIKLELLAHTGQDPVYRSNDGDFWDDPLSVRKASVLNSLMLDLQDQLQIEATREFDFTLVVGNPISMYEGDFYNAPDWFVGIEDSSGSTNPTELASGSDVPAPPTFLLLLAGCIVQRRRKP